MFVLRALGCDGVCVCVASLWRRFVMGCAPPRKRVRHGVSAIEHCASGFRTWSYVYILRFDS